MSFRFFLCEGAANERKNENDLNEVRESVVKSRNAEKVAAQEKDDLLIYLAHDLKTPLSSILGYTKLIEDEPTMPAESISRYAGIARAKAQSPP